MSESEEAEFSIDFLDVTEDYNPFTDFPGLIHYQHIGLVDDFEAVGSRITCNPAPTNTDEDWLVLTSKFSDLLKMLIDRNGFKYDGSEILDEEGNYVNYEFASLSLGNANMIITEDKDFFRKFFAASTVAKRLNLLNKDDRITLFQAVLYGNACEDRSTS